MKKMNISKQVKDLRLKHAFSQELLSEKSGLSLRTVQRIENNESSPSADSVQRIAEVFGVEVKELFEETPQPSAQLKIHLEFLLERSEDKDISSKELKVVKRFYDFLEDLCDMDLKQKEWDALEKYMSKFEHRDGGNYKYYRNQFSALKNFAASKLHVFPQYFFMVIGMSFGMSVGIVASAAGGESENIGIGLTMGMTIGLLIGLAIDHFIKRIDRTMRESY
jgi:transcriptional regulator with XRE-family HTH domain